MHACRAVALAAALMVVFAARPVQAGHEARQDVRQTGGETRLVIDADGVASVQHDLRWHVVRGPLRSIDVTDVDPVAVIEPVVAVIVDDGRTLPGRAVRRDERTVRIALDDPRAIVRGNVVVEIRARVDLVSAGELTRDGARWRLTLSSPAAADGFDGARLSVDLPAAPEEPRPVVAESGAVDEAAVATLRRGPDRDVLEVVRPHVARGEAAAWIIRVDPRALPLVADPRLRPPSEPRPLPGPDRVREALLGVVLAVLALVFGALVAHKGRVFSAACLACGGRSLGLLPLPARVRPVLAAAGLVAAVALEWAGQTTGGGLCIALSSLGAALRAPGAAPRVRGPGSWLALRPDEAFAPSSQPGHWLDVSTKAGRRTALGFGALIAAAAGVARRYDAELAWLMVLDAAPMVALLGTGCTVQLPPDGARSSAPWLAVVFRRLHAAATLRITPWARTRLDGTSDELRLLVVPCAAMPGVVGLEVGLAWNRMCGRWAATPEVLARVVVGSAAAARLAREVPAMRAVLGRRPDERVLHLRPRKPTQRSTVALVRALVDALSDRRTSLPEKPWAASERRSNEGAPPRSASAAA